jgi:predicted RNA-binding protein with PIN domain
VLLEPIFSFALEVPADQIGRAMSDIQRRCGSFEPPDMEGDTAILTGSVPVSSLGDYQREVSAYTGGRGHLSCVLKGYEPCHNTEEVVQASGYDPESDLENPSSSVFCSHGAGFVVPWDQVPAYAHADSGFEVQDGAQDGEEEESAGIRAKRGSEKDSQTGRGRSDYITTEEIEEIFQRTYGKSKSDYEPYRYHGTHGMDANRAGGAPDAPEGGSKEKQEMGKAAPGVRKEAEKREEYLLVDGYNIIFAWEDLRSLAAVNIDSARDKLMDVCCNYQGYHGCTLILVYDAYKVKGNPGSVLKYHNIYVVYTKEAETADQYIEKTVHKIGRKHHVTVATSDGLEQMIIWGDGAVRMSARGFREAVEATEAALRENYCTE